MILYQQTFVENLFMSLKIVFEKLYPSYAKKLWKFILDESVHLFIQILLICSIKYTPEEKQELIEKIKKDRNSMEELFLNILSKRETTPAIDKLEFLLEALSGAPEKIPENIFKLRIALDKKWNDNCAVNFDDLEMYTKAQERFGKRQKT